MITRLTNLDAAVVDLQWLGESFFREGQLPGAFKIDCFLETWHKLLKADIGAIWTLRREDRICGGIGGLIYPDMNDGDLVAMETFWYVAPEYRGTSDGIRLVREFELWAAMKGAKRIIMAYIFASMPESVAKFYERNGYRQLEMWYVKET